jgi:hemoglobin
MDREVCVGNGCPVASSAAAGSVDVALADIDPEDRHSSVSGWSARRAPTLYDLIGGEPQLRKLVETFYDIVEYEPEGRVLHVLHLRGHGVAHSRIEQFDFLSGFFGGPRLYIQKYAHSDVRQMHEHVEISAEARDAWLNCMSMAIDRVGFSADIKGRLMTPFMRVAAILVNRD